MSKFYIGQKVVAIRDHSQGVFKKGDEFTVLGIKQGCCSFELDIGKPSFSDSKRCTICNTRIIKKTNNHWLSENHFAPIELSETTFEEVIKQMNPKTVLN